MIESTKDILYIVIAFCVLWFTIFVCWAVYYVAMILREVRTVMADARQKIALLEKVLMAFKEKLESTSSHMKLLIETALNVAEYIKERKSGKKTAKKKK